MVMRCMPCAVCKDDVAFEERAQQAGLHQFH